MFGKNLKEINNKKVINKNEKLFFQISKICSEIEFSYMKIYMKKKKNFLIKEKNFYLFIEEGFLEINKRIYNNKSLISCKNNAYIKSYNDISFYMFFFRKVNSPKIFKITKLLATNVFLINYNIKKKYWGEILDLVNTDKGAIKIINMNRNTQSSMEFHIHKKENYFLDKGQLDLGIRYGRAKNAIIKLKKNNSFLMMPGTIHMRMAREDSKIVEMSTKDNDKDSIIIHDGKNYKFKIGKS
tara:strand:- start:25407 stop:26129 length:723 start_codon:yes stop_codon:yes gene_type:complete